MFYYYDDTLTVAGLPLGMIIGFVIGLIGIGVSKLFERRK